MCLSWKALAAASHSDRNCSGRGCTGAAGSRSRLTRASKMGRGRQQHSPDSAAFGLNLRDTCKWYHDHTGIRARASSAIPGRTIEGRQLGIFDSEARDDCYAARAMAVAT
jgi:hypothetical protein